MTNDEIANVLNGLIEISRDGAEGFRTCAEDVTEQTLKAYFEDRAQSCDKAVRELSAEVRHYDGDPDSSGTVTGSLHRFFVDLKSAITSRNILAVLEECERGEDAAVTAYEEALREELPDNVRVLLEQQYEGAKQNHNGVRQLRDKAKQNSNKS